MTSSLPAPAVARQATQDQITRINDALATAHLTPHEQRILTLIGEGMTNRQIARQTNLAEKTIKNYVSSLLAKLGVESRTQAAILVTRNTR